MLELILALVAGSIVLMGVYASYIVVAEQYKVNSIKAEIRDFAIPTIRLVSRDLRSAGYKAVDAEIESTYGKIDNPVVITDSGTACCDSLQIIYDKDTANRYRITYFVQQRNNPTRNALYMDVDRYDGATWQAVTNDAIVTDYIENFDVEGSNFTSAGQPKLVSFSMIFRSMNKTATTRAFAKAAYSTGNHNFSANDNYIREEFETAVRLRNIDE